MRKKTKLTEELVTIQKSTKQQFHKKINDITQQISYETRLGDMNRARSLGVGTAFGGVTEITMRMNDGRTIWAILQPVEVAELIHQLAGNIGCYVALKPRDDFSSWRNWRTVDGAQHPPFGNDLEPHVHIGNGNGNGNSLENRMALLEQEKKEFELSKLKELNETREEALTLAPLKPLSKRKNFSKSKTINKKEIED